MPGYRKLQFLRRNTSSIIRDFDQSPSRLFDRDCNGVRARVQGILDKLLDHGGGPFDDLTGRDLRGQLRGEQANGHTAII